MLNAHRVHRAIVKTFSKSDRVGQAIKIGSNVGTIDRIIPVDLMHRYTVQGNRLLLSLSMAAGIHLKSGYPTKTA